MEAIKDWRGPEIESSPLLQLTQKLCLHAGPCPAWPRLQNFWCMSPSYAAHGCPYRVGVLPSCLLLVASSWAGLRHYRVTSFPQATCAITVSGVDHFGQPWKAGIHRSAVERREGATPDGSSEVPGCPAFWLGQP